MHNLLGVLLLLALISLGVSWLWKKFVEYAKTNPVAEFIVGIPPEWLILGIILFVGLSLFLFILRKIYTAEKTSPLPAPAPEIATDNPSKSPPYKRNDCGSCRPISRHEEHLVNIAREVITLKTEILNRSEQELYRKLIAALGPTKRFIISPQVALRAFIEPPDEGKSWQALGGKHVDFLISDRNTTRPIVVIEYHGGGHFGETPKAKARVQKSDEIKEVLFKMTRIPLVVIKANEDFETAIKGRLFPILGISLPIEDPYSDSFV